MGRKTRTLTLFVGLALAVGTAFAGTAGASAPINGVGTVTCNVIATVSYKPPLSGIPGHPVVSTTITLKSKLTGCTGTGDGANVLSGSSTVSHVSPTNDCAEVLTPVTPPPPTPGTLKWKQKPATAKLTSSTIEFTSSTTTSGPPIIQDSTGSSLAGSFNGDTASAHSILLQDTTAITNSCIGKGLKKLNIVAGSTFSLT